MHGPAGGRGGIRGARAGAPAEPFPSEALADGGAVDGVLRTLGRRASRRARLRAPAAAHGAGSGKARVLTGFHVAEVSGPLPALTMELRWLAQVRELTLVSPAACA